MHLRIYFWPLRRISEGLYLVGQATFVLAVSVFFFSLHKAKFRKEIMVIPLPMFSITGNHVSV